jgi:glycosyltransferase involved in cell wall biosynthesis
VVAHGEPTLKDLTLSIALVTRNRPASLDRTLESLRRQDVQPFEVVLSDDSDEAQQIAVSSLAQKYNCVYQRGPRRGLYANRNAAARACRGTHYRTMDDDHEFPLGHLATCMEAIEQDRDAIWIIGEYTPEQSPQSNGIHPCPGELHPRGHCVMPSDAQHCRAISCGATIYPRSVVDRNIMNVDDFQFGDSYLEYGCRLRKLGYRIRHLQNTYIVHHLISDNRSYADQETDLAARLFSMRCLSFLYEPSVANRGQFLLELSKLGLTHPIALSKAWPIAAAAYRRHQRNWRELVQTQELHKTESEFATGAYLRQHRSLMGNHNSQP